MHTSLLHSYISIFSYISLHIAAYFCLHTHPLSHPHSLTHVLILHHFLILYSRFHQIMASHTHSLSHTSCMILSHLSHYSLSTGTFSLPVTVPLTVKLSTILCCIFRTWIIYITHDKTQFLLGWVCHIDWWLTNSCLACNTNLVKVLRQ